VRERFGEAAWEAVLSRLSTEEREILANADPGAWYEVKLQERVMNAFCQEFKADEALLMEAGRYDADRELSGVHRWFLRLMRPSFAVRHMNLYWRRSQDTGTWNSWQQGS
jgi:hypothetical protein